MTADMLYRHMLSMQCRYLKKDMVDSRMKYQETGDSAIRNQVKRTQNTFLHSVKASLFRGFQRKATFYYPIWWHTEPMAVNTFLESYDLTGKTILPFCTSGGSSISESMPDIREIAGTRGASVGTGLTANTLSESTIRNWLSDNGVR